MEVLKKNIIIIYNQEVMALMYANKSYDFASGLLFSNFQFYFFNPVSG